jgi:hypothetical protein
MRALNFMEELLALEAETKYLLTGNNRSYEQTLMQELSRIFNEAELLFGPAGYNRQRSLLWCSSRMVIREPHCMRGYSGN